MLRHTGTPNQVMWRLEGRETAWPCGRRQGAPAEGHSSVRHSSVRHSSRGWQRGMGSGRRGLHLLQGCGCTLGCTLWLMLLLKAFRWVCDAVGLLGLGERRRGVRGRRWRGGERPG